MIDQPELFHLVNRHQSHECTNYCYKNNQDVRICRFGFPKQSTDHTHIDPVTNKVIYKRTLFDKN